MVRVWSWPLRTSSPWETPSDQAGPSKVTLSEPANEFEALSASGRHSPSSRSLIHERK
jgi:hypothetical protein